MARAITISWLQTLQNGRRALQQTCKAVVSVSLLQQLRFSPTVTGLGSLPTPVQWVQQRSSGLRLAHWGSKGLIWAGGWGEDGKRSRRMCAGAGPRGWFWMVPKWIDGRKGGVKKPAWHWQMPRRQRGGQAAYRNSPVIGNNGCCHLALILFWWGSMPRRWLWSGFLFATLETPLQTCPWLLPKAHLASHC